MKFQVDSTEPDQTYANPNHQSLDACKVAARFSALSDRCPLMQLALMEKYERPATADDATATATAPEPSAMSQEEAIAILQARARNMSPLPC